MFRAVGIILGDEKNDSPRHGGRGPAMTDGAVDGSIFSTAGISAFVAEDYLWKVASEDVDHTCNFGLD
jgi:hypothetical protein